MLTPAAWLKHQLSKERAFPPRAEILAEMLRHRPGVKGALQPPDPTNFEYPVTDTAAHGWEEAQVI